MPVSITHAGSESNTIAASYDNEANALIGLDGEDESVIYMMVAGRSG